MGEKIDRLSEWWHNTRFVQWYHNSRIRRWIDEGNGVQPLEEMIKNPPTPSPSMEFIVRIVNAIRSDLISGIYIPSTDISAAYFPPIYYVFLSEPDIKGWTGERLEHLQARVSEGVMKKISELDKKKIAQTVRIEVRPDGTLNPGQIRVQSSPETSPTQDGIRCDDLPTVQDTIIDLPDLPTLYSIEVYKSGSLVASHNVVYSEIYVGRSKSSHIVLKGDERIGRTHASLILENAKLVISPLNENPLRVGNDVITKGERRTISDGDKVAIYDFTLIPRL